MTTAIQNNNHNLAIWSAVEKTDPAHTKTFSRTGGFSGTAVNQAYQARRATELFGPIGIGWGFDELEHQIVEGAGGDKVWFAKVRLWYQHDGRRGEVTQWGATTFVGRNKNGAFTDEEAAKKSITDAVGKCLSLLGFSADIYLGQFDDQKYVNDRRREEAVKKGAGERVQGTENAPVASREASPSLAPEIAAFRDAIAAADSIADVQRAEWLFREDRQRSGRPLSEIESSLVASCSEAACQRIRAAGGEGRQGDKATRGQGETRKRSTAPASANGHAPPAPAPNPQPLAPNLAAIAKPANGHAAALGPVTGEHLMQPRGQATAHPHPSGPHPSANGQRTTDNGLAPDIAAFRAFCAQATQVTDVKRGEHVLRSKRLRDRTGLGDAESELVASWADAACRRIRAARRSNS